MDEEELDCCELGCCNAEIECKTCGEPPTYCTC
ncbi:hypothetical protein SAMN05421505_16221 [Sinosporangium album]|uniref:Metallothionein n=1 Tax=Sinosporangium album TaxID=504805 RepID=A0A1G8L8J5_9ACTN|nr:hypothetical protein SAMN05421505_16221 [Sinosporangium album]